MTEGAYTRDSDWSAEPCNRHRPLHLRTSVGHQGHTWSCGWIGVHYLTMEPAEVRQ